ncbi:MAG: response regulator [Deltaproteobacteria bacterium]|nr:response regulator [Deltaproteobacteria bacterium]
MSQTVFNTMKDFCTLLIDDDDLIRDSLGIVFNANSQQFIAVESAEKGLDLIEKKKIDVIICDYRLPGMNGFEFFKRVSKFLPNVVKILITAYGDDEELCSLAKEIGIDAVIKKPFSPEIILNALTELLK